MRGLTYASYRAFVFLKHMQTKQNFETIHLPKENIMCVCSRKQPFYERQKITRYITNTIDEHNESNNIMVFTIMFMHISWMMIAHGGVIMLHTLYPFAEETTNKLGYVPTVCAHTIVSMIAHVIAVYYGVVGMYDQSQETDMAMTVIYVLSSNFIYDFILSWYGNKTISYETIFHHVISMSMGAYSCVYQGKLLYYACRNGFTEVSSIFLDIIYVFNCCPDWKKRYPRVLYACKIAFACAFLYVRVGCYTFWVVSFVVYEASDELVWIIPVVLAMLALQYYWGIQIVYKLVT